ncbi:hypothetical protein N752_04100 [Desulforamulus aquiferis]|nr:hypothetical protein N752_04100 [Desulforamulus aquiferis]
MSKIIITGGNPLHGKVKVSGAKNASLAILCGTLLAEDEVILENVPDISDVRILLEILGNMGCGVRWIEEDVLSVKGPQRLSDDAPYSW